MSPASLRILFTTLVLALVGAPAADARPGRVDLSEYIESPGERVPLRSTPDPKPNREDRAAKQGKKKDKVAKKAKGKAAKKAKRAARKRR